MAGHLDIQVTIDDLGQEITCSLADVVGQTDWTSEEEMCVRAAGGPSDGDLIGFLEPSTGDFEWHVGWTPERAANYAKDAMSGAANSVDKDSLVGGTITAYAVLRGGDLLEVADSHEGAVCAADAYDAEDEGVVEIRFLEVKVTSEEDCKYESQWAPKDSAAAPTKGAAPSPGP